MAWLLGDKLWQHLSTWMHTLIGIRPHILANVLNTAVLILAFLVIRRLVKRSLLRHVDETDMRYKVSKFVSILLTILLIFFIAKIWFSGLKLATYLGFVSAGLAIAFKDPLVNLAGWAFIVMRHPFRLGDRIQTGEHSGDVVDLSAFTFTILEVGNWVHADQSTGRLIHIPNGTIFNRPCANYTQGFEYIWNEIAVTITFESDFERAHQILSEIADSETIPTEEIEKQVEAMSDSYRVSYRYLTPIVWLDVEGDGVELTIRYMCHARKRRSSADRIWRKILKAFAAEAHIDFAYKTTRFYNNEKEGKAPIPAKMEDSDGS